MPVYAAGTKPLPSLNEPKKTERLTFPFIIRLTLFLLVCLPLGCTRREKSSPSSNRLSEASSPYLQEHADNPVDWYEWGAEALEKAKKENKPLIISIGYASCHWCHVMERESFMDTAVARIMNDNFVAIKIDREERPDIDQIYLQAAQLISGNAGWPLNAFALPDGKPFFAATYFPKQQWITLLNQVSKAYKTDYESIVRQAEDLTNGVQSYDAIRMPADSTRSFGEDTYRQILANAQPMLDYKDGGLSGAPKFPMPAVWEFLLQNHHLTGDKKALQLVTLTLDNISKGGITDHLGGGFARYSTDDKWMAPHFEKMLYDNGQLMSLYAHGFQVTKDSAYADVISETHRFIKRELTSPEGGFYSSVNADSEGEEGKFYVWTAAEIDGALDSVTAEVFREYYHVTDTGNWEQGKNILHRAVSADELAKKMKMKPGECARILNAAETKLFAIRDKRIRPAVDDKILLSWNALMMKGYLDAYAARGDVNYLQTALSNAQFISKHMMRDNGALWHSYKDGKATIDAFLDDYALLARSFIGLYQATFEIAWLDKAKALADYAVAHFRDKRTAMFYYTADGAEGLVARKMEIADNVIPSSNSVMAEVLFLLGEYYGDESYITMSVSMLNQVLKEVTTSGPYYANWAALMGTMVFQPFEVAVVGPDALVKSRQIKQEYHPTAIFMGGTAENLPLLENKLIPGRTIIYVCRNKVCKLPVEDAGSALKQLTISH